MSATTGNIDLSCRMRQDTPPTVYQTLVDENGTQDSSTPLAVSIDLSAHVAGGFSKANASAKPSILHSLVFGSIRRLDGAPLLVWRADSELADTVSGELAPLQLPSACFQYELSDKVLSVKIHRKYLPVSKCHGDAPFVFTFILSPGHGCAPSLVVTSPFISASKEPRAVHAGPKPQPKRKRAPPSSKPIAAPLTENDRIIQAAFPAYLASQSDQGSVSSGASAPGTGTFPSLPAGCTSAAPPQAPSPAQHAQGRGQGNMHVASPEGDDMDTTVQASSSKRRRTSAEKQTCSSSAVPPLPLPSAMPTSITAEVQGQTGTGATVDRLPVPMSLTPMLRSAVPASSPPSIPWGLPGPSPTLPWPVGSAAVLPMPALQLAQNTEEALEDMSGVEEDMMSWAYSSTAGSGSSPLSLPSSSASPSSGYSTDHEGQQGHRARGLSFAFELDLPHLA